MRTMMTSFLVAILLTACTKSQDYDDKKMVYYKSHADDVKTMDPATAYDTISWDVLPEIYETLFEYDYLSDSYKLIPLLAADMPRFSSDGLTVRIPIRKGIRFHNDKAFTQTAGHGRELVAQDFIYAFKRLAIPSIQSQGMWIFDGKIVGFTEFHEKLKKAKKEDLAKIFSEPIAGFKAVDSHTLEIKLIRPYPQLLYVLAMPFTAPVPFEAIDAYGDENGNLHDHPIGTGAFLLKEWNRGHRIVLEKNSTYHEQFYPTSGAEQFKKAGMLADAGKPIPFLDIIHIEVIKEDQPTWLKFLKGKLDAAGIPKDNFAQSIINKINLSDDLTKKGIKLFIENEATFYYIGFNMLDGVVGKNKYLRQAISSAVDREKFIELFTNNRGLKATTVLPPGIDGRPAKSQIKYDFNISRAKELLVKAGFPGGQGLPPIKFDMRGADSLNRQMGEFFTKQMADVGITLQVIYNTFPAYLEKAKQGNLQVFMGGWAMDYPDAENAYQLLYGPNKAPGPNDTSFDHKELNQLYDKMAVLLPSAQRTSIIQRMDDLIQEEAPWALLYCRVSYVLHHDWFKNYRPNQIIQGAKKYYRIDQARKKELEKMF